MSIKGFKGYGFTSIETSHVTTQTVLLNGPMSSWSLNADDTEVESKGYPIGGVGLLENIYTFISERVWNLEVGMQAFDWGMMQLVFGVFERVTSSFKFRRSYTGTVPSGSPYEITDSNLVGLTAADVHVSFFATTSKEYYPAKIVGAAPTATTEVQLDATNGKLIFHSSDAGLAFSYQLRESYTNVKTINVESDSRTLDTVSFSGVMVLNSKPSEIGIDVPSMGKTGGLTLSAAEENTVTFKPTVSGSNVSAVRIIKLPA